MSETNRPEADAVLEAPGTSCVNLTPQIRESIMPLASGQVLEVRSDDPAAREGVPAWSRLTGHRDSHRRRWYEKGSATAPGTSCRVWSRSLHGGDGCV